jgi:hypothetical protein
MLNVVFERYEDILTEDDLSFFNSIDHCSNTSLRLLVRLYLRKGPNFLVAKLSYPEVPSIDNAIHELCELELIEQNPIVYAYELIELLPIASSRKFFSNNPKCRKADLIEAWFEDEELETCQAWGVDDPIITPCHYESFRRIQMLYFSNERQGITEFILEDIGLFRYEAYSLDKSTRLFNSAAEVDSYLLLNDLSSEFYLMNDAKLWDGLEDLTIKVQALQLPERLHNKWFRLLNRIAYRLEQLGELTRALELFRTNRLPPSRERQARILFKQEKYDESLSILNQINSSPLTADETQFYLRFINKALKKLGQQTLRHTKPTIMTTNHSWKRGEGSVEEQAVNYFGNSVWLENNLPMAVFGLIYWDAIFADIPGVWHHPFQSAPSDLSDPEFCTRRQQWLQLIDSQTKEEWRMSIQAHWQGKLDLRNPFVNWKQVSLPWVLDCFDSLSQEQWRGLFKHLFTDLRQHKSGFPDLFHKTDDGYRFIEIKGPGDKLQDNQINWLNQFQKLGIKAEVCYVQYLDD